MREEAPDKKAQLANALIGFLSRYRIILLSLAALVIVVLVALFVILGIQENRRETSYAELESLQKDVAEWFATTPDATEDQPGQREATAATLVDRAAELSDRYPRAYAGVRAAMIQGEIHRELEHWADAAVSFGQMAELDPDSYLAPIGLMHAAVAYESAEMTDEAVAALTRIVEDYGDLSADAPRALFSLGRISETNGDLAEASLRYNQVIERYPSSGWTNLARDRILLLTAQGRIGE